jgi:short subunit dehydrogenase-like uncharacterized protein
MAERRYDIVLYGATGFVGSRAAEYLAAHAQLHARRWAIAGRDSGKLEAMQRRLGGRPDVRVADGHSREEIERNRDPQGVRFDATIGAWVGPFVMGPINTRIVRRSAALHAGWGEPYGPGFRYQEYAKYGAPLARAKAALVTGLMSGFDAAMSRPAVRHLLTKVLPKPGTGPAEKTMARGWFVTELIARAADGRRARAEIAFGGDPGNRATLRLLCESGLCLAFDGDTLPGGAMRGGVLTPATALGEALLPRLRAAGFRIGVGA